MQPTDNSTAGEEDPGAALDSQPGGDVARKSAHPGERYENAPLGGHANDTLGRKGFQPPGGPTAVMKDQQKTPAELEKSLPPDPRAP